MISKANCAREAPAEGDGDSPIQIEQDWRESSALTALAKTISPSAGRRLGTRMRTDRGAGYHPPLC